MLQGNFSQLPSVRKNYPDAKGKSKSRNYMQLHSNGNERVSENGGGNISVLKDKVHQFLNQCTFALEGGESSQKDLQKAFADFDVLTRNQKRACVTTLVHGYKILLEFMNAIPEATKRASSIACVQKIIKVYYESLKADKIIFLANSSKKTALYNAIESIRKQHALQIGTTKKFTGINRSRPSTANQENVPVVVAEIGDNNNIAKFMSSYIKKLNKKAALMWIPIVDEKKAESGDVQVTETAILGAIIAYFDQGYEQVSQLDNSIGYSVVTHMAKVTGQVVKHSLVAHDSSILKNQLQGVKSIVELMVSAQSLEDLGILVADRVGFILSCDQVRLYLLDAKKGEMWHVRDTGERGSEDQKRVSNRPDNSIVGQCISTGQIIKEGNALDNIRYNADIDGKANGLTAMPLLCVPITLSDKVVGVLRATGKATAFQQHEIHALSIIAKQVEWTVQCQRLKDVASSAVDATVAAQSHASEIIDLQAKEANEVDIQKVIQQRIEPAKILLEADRCTVFVVDKKRNLLISRYRSDTAEGSQDNVIEVPLGIGLASYAATSGVPVVIEDAYLDSRFNQDVDKMTGYRTGSVLVVPIIKKRKGDVGEPIATVAHRAHPDVIGVVQMINKNEGVFTNQDLQTLQAFAAGAVGVIESGNAIDMIKKEVSKIQKRSADLLEVGRSLFTTQDLSAMVHLIMQRAKELLEADRCTLFLVDKKHNEIVSNFTDNVVEIRVPMGVGIAGTVAKTGEIITITNAYTDSRFNSEMDKITGYTTRSMLVVPIRRIDGEVMGVVQMINKKHPQEETFNAKKWGLFDATDIGLLQEISSQAAVALENNESMNAVMRAQNKSKELFEIAQAMTSQRELSQLFTTIMDSAKELLQVDRCTLFLVDEENDQLWSLVANGTEEIRIPKSSGIVGSVVTSKERINIQDAYLDERFNPDVDRQTGYRTKSVLCLPIISKENVIGVMQMINKIANYEDYKKSGGKFEPVVTVFTSEDEDLLIALSSQVAIAVENATVLHRTIGAKGQMEEIIASGSDFVFMMDNDGHLSTPMEGDAELTNKMKVILSNHPTIMDDVEGVRKSGDKREGYVENAKLNEEGTASNFKYTIKPLKKEDGVILLWDMYDASRALKEDLSKVMSQDAVDTLYPLFEDKSSPVADVQVAVLTLKLYNSAGEKLSMLYRNDLYMKVGKVFEKNCGTLIDIVDGCMLYAYFADPNNPDSGVKVVSHACKSAIAAMKLMQEENLSVDEDRKVILSIGIDKGHGVCGLIGSKRKGKIMVEGEVGKIAYEICNLSHIYKCTILVTEACFAFSRDSLLFRELDTVSLRGVAHDITIHELVGFTADTIHDESVHSFKHYKNGIGHYRARRWKLASESFKLGVTLSDTASSEMYTRCLRYMEYPAAAPQQAWSGVFQTHTDAGSYTNIKS